MLSLLRRRSAPRSEPSAEVTIDVEVLRQIVIDVLLEQCDDPRGVLFLQEIEATSIAGRIRERVLRSCYQRQPSTSR